MVGIITQLLACGGGGGGGGNPPSNDPNSSGSIIPKNAVTFTENNAESHLKNVTSTTLNTAISTGAEVIDASPGFALETINDSVKQVHQQRRTNAIEMATGIVETDTWDCPYGGSATDTYTFNETATTWSDIGTTTYTNCALAPSLTISGNISYDHFENTSTGIYSYKLTGNSTFSSDGFIFSIKNLVYAETGNFFDNAYSLNKLNFTFDTNSGDGFYLTVDPKIVGIYGECPSSGSLTLTGANDTQARATFIDGTVKIEVNTGSGFTLVRTAACTGWEFTNE